LYYSLEIKRGALQIVPKSSRGKGRRCRRLYPW